MSGGGEFKHHKNGSLHYAQRAVDISMLNIGVGATEAVYDAAARAGFAYGITEVFPNNPNRDHWHLQMPYHRTNLNPDAPHVHYLPDRLPR